MTIVKPKTKINRQYDKNTYEINIHIKKKRTAWEVLRWAGSIFNFCIYLNIFV